MRIRRSLSMHQKEALKSLKGARVLVEDMNAEICQLKNEIENLQANYADTQNKYEEMLANYHKADKDNGVLSSKLEFLFGIEIIKFVLAGVGAGYGINLASAGHGEGWIIVGVSSLLYIFIAKWQESRTKGK